MTLNLINRLKHRGYKQSQILKHVNEIKFNQRKEALSTKKGKTQKLVFVTQFCDEASDTELIFLDLTLYKGDRFQTNGILDIRTHIKPTNSYMYTQTHIIPLVY